MPVSVYEEPDQLGRYNPRDLSLTSYTKSAHKGDSDKPVQSVKPHRVFPAFLLDKMKAFPQGIVTDRLTTHFSQRGA